MRFNLPKLTTDIDCEPIGYPGLTVQFWLNPTSPAERYSPPDNAEKWESAYWVGLARAIESITIPPSMTDSGKPLVIPIDSGKTLYNLMDEEGFDWHIVLWAVDRYTDERQERLKTEIKN